MHRRGGRGAGQHRRAPRARCTPTPTGWCRPCSTCWATRSSSPTPAATSRSAREAQGDFVEFAIRDDGRGIPEDELDQIFSRFHQVDSSDAREKGGSGLGLSISRSIVERLGGRIWAQNNAGAGATFLFTLPAHRTGRRSASYARGAAGGDRQRRRPTARIFLSRPKVGFNPSGTVGLADGSPRPPMVTHRRPWWRNHPTVSRMPLRTRFPVRSRRRTIPAADQSQHGIGRRPYPAGRLRLGPVRRRSRRLQPHPAELGDSCRTPWCARLPGRTRSPGAVGDVAYCVYAAAYASTPGDQAWAGIAWAVHRGPVGRRPVRRTHRVARSRCSVTTSRVTIETMSQTRGHPVPDRRPDRQRPRSASTIRCAPSSSPPTAQRDGATYSTRRDSSCALRPNLQTGHDIWTAGGPWRFTREAVITGPPRRVLVLALPPGVRAAASPGCRPPGSDPGRVLRPDGGSTDRQVRGLGGRGRARSAWSR